MEMWAIKSAFMDILQPRGLLIINAIVKFRDSDIRSSLHEYILNLLKGFSSFLSHETAIGETRGLLLAKKSNYDTALVAWKVVIHRYRLHLSFPLRTFIVSGISFNCEEIKLAGNR